MKNTKSDWESYHCSGCTDSDPLGGTHCCGNMEHGPEPKRDCGSSWEMRFDDLFVDEKVKQVDASNSIVLYPWKNTHSHQSQEVKSFIRSQIEQAELRGYDKGLKYAKKK